ncbi:unnamed protein product [Clavelina lepadiformis]|uniref:Uncharacterized protein n=1 Tax=Clavelina lepadiformis TaxID=159417 RepID=A0ABP0FNS2_CLALP
MSNITEVEHGRVPEVVYDQQSDDPEVYLSEQLKSRKQRMGGLIVVAKAKDSFDEKLASCLQTCQEYLQKVPQGAERKIKRTEAIQNLQEMEAGN